MQMLQMGGNAPVPEQRFDLVIGWPAAAGSLDSSVYLLGENGKVRGDADMIFYNQRADADGSVRITNAQRGQVHLSIDLDRVPSDVARIVVCVTIEEPDRRMSAFEGTSVTLETKGSAALCFRPDLTHASELAMRLVALYRRNGVWKLRADGQGYNDGLAPLARSFGIDVAEDEAPPPKGDVQERPATGSVPPRPLAARLPDTPIEFDVPEAAPSPAQPVPDDGSIRLTDERPAASWDIRGRPEIGEIAAVLTWQGRRGGMNGRPRAFEPAFGCFYEMADGRKGLVQSWDGNGQLEAYPFLHLGPVKLDGNRGEQRLRVSGRGMPPIRSLTLFAHLQADAPNWYASTMHLGLSMPGEPPVTLSGEEGPEGKGIVALLRLRYVRDGIDVERLMRFADGHRELDRELGWGLRWKTFYPSNGR
jgi:tellurite resistance protein TerA